MAALSSTSTLKDITPAYNPNYADSKRETMIRTAIEKDSTATELPVDVNASTLAEIVGDMKYKKGVEGPYPDKPLKTKIWKKICKDTQDADMFTLKPKIWKKICKDTQDADMFTRLMEKDKQNIDDLMLAASYLDIFSTTDPNKTESNCFYSSIKSDFF